MPIVSVVIPTYNRAQLLERAIQSVLSQTFKDYEIIVVDDASSDNTSLLFKKAEYKHIKYLRSEKVGGAVARNLGIKASTGKYIAFLDDDDEWYPEKLQKQIEILDANPNAGVCYTGRSVICKGKQRIGFNKKYSFRFPQSDNHYLAIMTDNFIGITSSVIIPRSVLVEINGFDENLPCFQDYDLFIRILKHWKAVGINQSLVKYYLGDTKEQVSFTRDKIFIATEYLLNKYKDAQHYILLKKALRNINIKKMIKSFGYTKEVFSHQIKKIFQ